MSKQKIQRIEISLDERTALLIILNGALGILEEDYKENKNNNSFNKEDALSEINLLKGLIEKIEKLEYE